MLSQYLEYFGVPATPACYGSQRLLGSVTLICITMAVSKLDMIMESFRAVVSNLVFTSHNHHKVLSLLVKTAIGPLRKMNVSFVIKYSLQTLGTGVGQP